MFQNPSSILVQQGSCEGRSDAWSAAKRRGKKAGKRKEEMSTEGKRKEKKKSRGINYGRLLRRVSMYVLLFFAFVVLSPSLVLVL